MMLKQFTCQWITLRISVVLVLISLGMAFGITLVVAPAHSIHAQTAELGLTKSASSNPMVGTPFTYTLAITQTGIVTATNLTLTDTLLSQVSFVTGTTSLNTFCFETTAIVCAMGDVTTTQFPVTIWITVTPTIAAIIVNTATVSADEVTNPVTATNTVTVAPVADLMIRKSSSSSEVPVGSLLTYTVVVTNTGPSPATGIRLTDTLSGGGTFVSAIPGCVIGNVVTCSLAFLNTTTSQTFTIAVKSAATGIVTNTASVTGLEFDPITSNNEFTVTTTITKTNVYLPLVTRDYQPLVNGNFDNGLAGWVQGAGSFNGHGNGVPRLADSNQALLGNPSTQNGSTPVGYGYIAQTFTVDKRYVKFSYRVETFDVVKGIQYYDTFEVSVNLPPNQITDNDRNNRGCATTRLDPTGTLAVSPSDGLIFCGGYGGSTSGTKQTIGWNTVQLDFETFRGNITLYLALWSREYSPPYWDDRAFYNTWTYIDNVQVTDSP